ALLVFVECRDDVLLVLPGDLRHPVDLGEARLVARDLVAADAHVGLLLSGRRILREGARGNADEACDQRRETREKDNLLLHGQGARAGWTQPRIIRAPLY